MIMISQSGAPLTNIVVRVPDDYHDNVAYENIRSHVDFKNLYMIAPYSAGDVLEPIYRTEAYRPACTQYYPKWQYNPNYNHKIDTVTRTFKARFGRNMHKDEHAILIPDPIDFNSYYYRLAIVSEGEAAVWQIHHVKSGEAYNYDGMSIYSTYCLVFGEDGVHARLIRKDKLGYEQFNEHSYEGFKKLCGLINS